MIKTVLISGVTGFIGSHLLESLLSEKKFKIVILKRSFSNKKRINRFLRKVKVYNIDKCGIDLPFRENKIDLVINLVTNYGRGNGVKPSDIFETNVIFSLKLIEEAVNAKVKYFFNTDSALAPEINLYAYSKKVFKYLIQNYFADKINIFNLRLEYVYGENDDLSKFIPMAVAKLKNNEELNMTKGEQKLDFIYVKDCVEAITYLIKNSDSYKNNFEEFQIGTGQTKTLKEFIQIIKRELKSKSIINYGAIPYRAYEQMYSKADISKLGGWQPKYRLKDSIRSLLDK